jgi:predicted metal-dependent phosphoesterase TrpH
MKKLILAEVSAVILVAVILVSMYTTNASISASPSIPSNSPVITLRNPWVQKNATYKGALHCHSTNSLDAHLSPYNVSKAYSDQGFNFVAITDHNTLTSYTPVTGILALPGEEVSTSLVFPPHSYKDLSGHIVALNIKTTIKPWNTPQAEIDTINSQGGTAILAHPTSTVPTWFFSNETLKTLTNYSFIEITNSDAATAIKLYDKMLSNGKVVWAVGTDDAHTLTEVNMKGSVIVNADRLTIEDVMSSLRAGNFYVTTGRGDPATPGDARISSITVSGLTITVKVPEASTIQWITKDGVVAKASTDVLQGSYTVRGDEKYVRVMTTLSSNENKHAWSQPILIDVS